MKRIVLLGAVLLSFWASSGSAQAAPSVLGGKLLPRGDDAVRMWFGFPGFGASYHTLLTPALQVGPTLSMDYGTSLGVGAPVLFLNAGSEFKFRLYGKDKFALAFVAEPTFRLGFHPTFMFGMGFRPRVQGTYDLTSQVSLLMRFGLPFEMLFYPTFVFYLPIAAGVGVEFPIADSWSMYLDQDIGSVVGVFSGGSMVQLYYRGEVGVVYRF